MTDIYNYYLNGFISFMFQLIMQALPCAPGPGSTGLARPGGVVKRTSFLIMFKHMTCYAW